MELVWIAIGWAMGWLVREALDEVEMVTHDRQVGSGREGGPA